MAYGPTRYLYHNYLQDVSTLAASQQAYGVLSGAEKIHGSGSASMYAIGNYTGNTNLIITVQIDAEGTGAIGNATFRWRTNETASGSWEATGVLTSSTPIPLGSDGKQNAWISLPNSDEQDLYLWDEWQFDAFAHYADTNLYDFNPLTYFRSLNVSTTLTLTVDFGTPRNIKACLFYDTNLTSSATILLKGNTSDSWGSPAYSTGITPEEVTYIDQEYRYWRGEITDATNPDEYIEIGHWFLGDYLQLTGNGFWGSSQRHGYTSQKERNPTGIHRNTLHRKQREYTLNYSIAHQADLTDLLTMRDYLIDEPNRSLQSLFLHVFSDGTDDLILADWQNMLSFDTIYHSNEIYQYNLKFQEMAKGKIRN